MFVKVLIITVSVITCCKSQIERRATLSEFLSLLDQHNTSLADYLNAVRPPLQRLPDINSFGPKDIPVQNRPAVGEEFPGQVVEDEPVFEPQFIRVEPNIAPIKVRFESQSSGLELNQLQVNDDQGLAQVAQHVDQPLELVHEEYQPVVQDIHENVKPYGIVSQIVRPVQQYIDTIVNNRRQYFTSAPQQISEPIIAEQPISPPEVLVHQPVVAVAPTPYARVEKTIPTYSRIYAHSSGGYSRASDLTPLIRSAPPAVVYNPQPRPISPAPWGSHQNTPRYGQRILISKHREYP